MDTEHTESAAAQASVYICPLHIEAWTTLSNPI